MVMVCLVLAVAMIFGVIAWLSDIPWDMGDGLEHYMISRYSWEHPHLFLHHWGKPLFILASSPFAQLGLKGMMLFNILCVTLSCLLAALLCEKLQMNYSWQVVIFVAFSPIYFATVFSGLTEPFFGLVLILSVYFAIKKNFALAAFAVSFLPFCRTEGYLLLPLFFIVLLLRKKFWQVLLLATGNVIYTVIGYFYYRDWLWIIHQNPYKGAADIYGHGGIFDFVNQNEYIWGVPLVVLFISGLFHFISRLWMKKISPEFLREEVFLILGSFLVYFVFHSVAWWKGMFSSLGLIRVIAAIMPLSAIVCMRGMQLFFVLLRKNIWAEAILALVASVSVVYYPFRQHNVPFKIQGEEAVIKPAVEWLRQSAGSYKKVYYLHPFVPIVLEADKFSNDKVIDAGGLDKQTFVQQMPAGSVLLWDAHYGPNEGRTPLEKLTADSTLEVLGNFSPKEKFRVLGGNKFEVWLFLKK
jgi:hypothetical protein